LKAENDGVRAGEQLDGNIRMRCLSDRRRVDDWNVESVRGAGRVGLGAAGKRPKMIAVQSAGCAPMVRALTNMQRQQDVGERGDVCLWAASAETVRDYIMLEILKESEGVALAFR